MIEPRNNIIQQFYFSAKSGLEPLLVLFFTSHFHSVKTNTVCEYYFSHKYDFTVSPKCFFFNSIVTFKIGNVVVTVPTLHNGCVCLWYYDIGSIVEIERQGDVPEFCCLPASREEHFQVMIGLVVISIVWSYFHGMNSSFQSLTPPPSDKYEGLTKDGNEVYQ